MASSTQANFDTEKNADAHAQGIDGGLNLKTDASRLAPPATTRSDNVWYDTPGNVQQLPPFASTMQASTTHVYNAHARDLQQPSTVGDVMLHGETLDAPGSSTNLFTSPTWSDGSGTSLNRQQPCLPVNLRTRVLTGRLSVADTITTGVANLMITKQEAGYASGQQRYALAYYDGQYNGATLHVTFGLTEGQVETGETMLLPLTCDYCEILAVQGTNYWCLAYVSGGTLTYKCFDFFGNAAGQSLTIAPVSPYNGNASGTFAPISLFNHAARTFVGYVTNPGSGGACVVSICDIISGQAYSFGISAANPAPGGLAFSSPYSHTAVTGQIYFSIFFSNQAYIVTQTVTAAMGPLVSGSVVGGGIAIASASNTGYDSTQTPTGSVNYTTTSVMNVFDAKGGVGGTASLGLTIFRHYPEQISSTTTFWYQSVSVDRFQFAANATTPSATGTLTAIGQNIFRTPSGVSLCSKAFTLQPGSAFGAGLSAAKSAYVLVRCGASEPQVNFSGNYSGNPYNNYWTYGQPTYFLIDHQARVVSRIFESQGVPDCGYYLSNNTTYRRNSSTAWGTASMFNSLSAPLVGAPASDTSALDITLPAWVQVNGTTQVAYTLNGVTYFVGQPSNLIMQPAGITLSLSNQSAGCPPVQAGPYTVLSGAMTCVHDGRGVVEANYHFAAHNPIVSVTSTTTSPGAGASGTYYWSVVWEWFDSFGRVHRSIPSAPFPGVVPSGSYLASATIQMPQPVTIKTAVGGIMYARLYRSVLNNTSGIFYLVSTTPIMALSGTNYFATLPDSGAYLDASSTPAISAGQQAITVQPRRYIDQSSATVVNTYLSTPPPPFIWQVGTKGRSFGLAQILGQHRLYYTSVQQANIPFEWNVNNYASVPPDIGDVRSIEALDDKIILFGTRSNAVVSGDGPPSANSGGAPSPGDGFSLIQPIPTPVGIVGSGAPSRIPDGIVFQGFSGIQLISRSLEVQPIGAAVDPLTGRQVNNAGQIYGRATTLASLQSVVWCNAQGPALVYNYLTQKWSTWPLLSNAVSIVQRLDGTIFAGVQPVVNGTYAGLASTTQNGSDFGNLGLAYAPIYLGNNVAPGIVVETPWILPSGESGGESQIWDCTFTGSWVGPHITKIEQAYDYNNAYVSTQVFNWPTAPLNYQMRVRPLAKSDRIAIRYRVTLLPITTLAAGYPMATLGDLVLNFASKQGTSRLGGPFSG